MSISFEEPRPQRPGRPAKYLTPEVRAELEANPGKWARLENATNKGSARTVATFIAKHPEYETTARGSGDDMLIYVRYVGLP